MKILYQANDGTIFENEWNCEEYEAKMEHPYLKDIEFFTEKGCPYFINNDNFLSDDTYGDCWKIIIHNVNELKDLAWLADYCGWCEFGQITEPGTWKRYKEFFFEGRWEKI